jgi:hypothetical protein
MLRLARLGALAGLLALGMLLGCSEPAEVPAASPSVPAVMTVPTAVSVREQPRVREGDEPPEIQQRRVSDAVEVLKRLGTAADGSAADTRPGASTFRMAELEKLGELVAAACRGADAPCREILEHVAAATLPFDEGREIYGRFLGDLRPRAHIAADTLGGSFLVREDGAARDVAFRIAVGSGAARRGQADAENRRATTIPLRPRVGEPVWIVFEWMAPCKDIEMDLKGPDVNGRLDLVPRDPCPPKVQDPTELVPRAIRAVWAHRLDALPAVGLEVWLPDAPSPLLAVTLREVETTPKTDP